MPAGRTVIPGLIDNHIHYLRGTKFAAYETRIHGVTSRQEVMARISSRAKELGPGRWIFILGGWSEQQFAHEPGGFTREELDEAAPDNPVFIQRTYSTFYMNSLAVDRIAPAIPELYEGGSIVRTSETLEGVQNGIVDIGGFCYCFEPSNLPLHAFQVMLPFGTMDPTVSLKIAQDVYREVPYLTEVFEEEFNQKLLARIADSTGILVGLALGCAYLGTAGLLSMIRIPPSARTGIDRFSSGIHFASVMLAVALGLPLPTIGSQAIDWTVTGIVLGAVTLLVGASFS